MNIALRTRAAACARAARAALAITAIAAGTVTFTGTLQPALAATQRDSPVAAASVTGHYAAVPGGEFRSILPSGSASDHIRVRPFFLQRTPVTNAQFLGFVRAHPEWQRGRVPASKSDEHYLQHWHGALDPGPEALPNQPVTNVSWFAARAYCESQGARLPDWNEWEFAAAADANVPDARKDPVWQQRILAWYARPSTQPLPAVGQDLPNLYHIHDLHGLVWEWVEDFNALFISADNREQGDPDLLKFCGSGALTVEDRENYPVMMRLALLSSLRANSTTLNVGFRCAHPSHSHYHADIPLQGQDGRAVTLPPQAGHLRIVTLFYAGCPMACPLTIETLRSIDQQLTAPERARLEVLMVTLDPSNDSKAVLRKITAERRLDTSRWTLARSAPEDVRLLSAMLDIPYRALPDGSFNHASALVLMDPEGNVLQRSTKLGLPDPAFVAAIRQALAGTH